MPLYVYECNGCDNLTEKIQKLSDPPLKQCGFCGSKLKKLFFPSGLIFKGKGFYKTDYK